MVRDCDTTKQELPKTILFELGSRYSLNAILRLQENLNLENYSSCRPGANHYYIRVIKGAYDSSILYL